ncbi:MAG: MotA/TolQ/ExbB proton channel family protein [Syntrophaceae bacterium]
MKQRLILAGGAVIFMIMAGSVLGKTSLAVNLQSFLMVLGGTLLSALLAFPLPTFTDLVHSLRHVYRHTSPDMSHTIQQITVLARVRRSSGPRELNAYGEKADNLFLRKGIDLIADGYSLHEIQFIMEKEYELYFSSKESQINILNTMAKIAPAFGFLGTVLGLISILHTMGDPTTIGKGMSLALLTTLYGLMFTNFLFLPMARKLSEYVKSEATLLNIVLEGLLGIAESKNPVAISHRLKSYLDANTHSSWRAPMAPDKRAAAVVDMSMAVVTAGAQDVPVGQ